VIAFVMDRRTSAEYDSKTAVIYTKDATSSLPSAAFLGTVTSAERVIVTLPIPKEPSRIVDLQAQSISLN
jgi:hypothetical protein